MSTFGAVTGRPIRIEDKLVAPGAPADVVKLLRYAAKLDRKCSLERAKEEEQEEDSGPLYIEDDQGGFEAGICTEGAEWLRERLGRGEVYGYDTDDPDAPDYNPTAKVGEYAGGHDFLIVDGRWLVDWWAAYYEGTFDWVVLDMQKQAALVDELYGDRSTWSRLADRRER
jgi:hypothetical protein